MRSKKVPLQSEASLWHENNFLKSQISELQKVINDMVSYTNTQISQPHFASGHKKLTKKTLSRDLSMNKDLLFNSTQVFKSPLTPKQESDKRPESPNQSQKTVERLFHSINKRGRSPPQYQGSSRLIDQKRLCELNGSTLERRSPSPTQKIASLPRLTFAKGVDDVSAILYSRSQVQSDLELHYLEQGSRCVAVSEAGEPIAVLTIKKVEVLENSDRLTAEIA